jgi:hypothetical protein
MKGCRRHRGVKVIHNAGMLANQYGRTSFLFAGVPGMQAPVSFYNDPSIANGLSVYEQVYNASIFSLYLPIANEADFNNAYPPRNYTQEEFYHTLLMTNHMESDPDEFAEGAANGYTDQGAEFGQSVPAVVSNALNPSLNVER